MGSQNHIYSKKKLIKWKQGQGEGGGGCSLAALRPLCWLREGERDVGSCLPWGGCLGAGIWCWRGCGVETLPMRQRSTK